MAQLSCKNSISVFRVVYSYDDLEINKSFDIVELCKSFHDVVEYLASIENELTIQDNAFYKCRSNIRIKVSPFSVSEKKYVQLFK